MLGGTLTSSRGAPLESAKVVPSHGAGPMSASTRESAGASIASPAMYSVMLAAPLSVGAAVRRAPCVLEIRRGIRRARHLPTLRGASGRARVARVSVGRNGCGACRPRDLLGRDTDAKLAPAAPTGGAETDDPRLRIRLAAECPPVRATLGDRKSVV